jgi:threonine dehydrogenase-like Zn-dependent dehydrogenase
MSSAATTTAYDEYRHAQEAPRGPVLAWNVYGTGIERVGRDGRPEPVEIPPLGADQLLIRVDAVGLCFSDVKLIRLGGDHPKLYGRDLEKEPTRLGHEASVTVMAVGSELADRFRPGQRLAIQPDIYVDGRSTAYGYTIPGGLIQAHNIGPEVLAADDGAYVVEVDDRLGYAETALTEPWACVEAAYTQRRRLSPLARGRMLVSARPDDERPYRFGDVLGRAREIVLSGAGPALESAVRAAAPQATIEIAGTGETPGAAADQGSFDDVILLAPRDPVAVARAADLLAFRGVLNLVGDEPLDGDVEIDVGRIHYHYTAYVGTTGLDVGAAYGEARNRAELRTGGVTVVVGAAGPMGQMHVERALGLPDGPRLVIAVDLDAERLAAATERLKPVAKARGRELVVELLGPEPDALVSAIRRHNGGNLADDVVITAPSARAVVAGAQAMAPDGMLVLFAGVPVGTRAALDLSPVFLTGAQYTGTSGSRIADQALVVQKTFAGQLEPRRALAAVGGMEAAQEALRALVEGRFPGKIVIFPALSGLPLTPLTELAETHPEVAAALDADGSWTTEAEARLFARHLPVAAAR